MKAHSSSLSPTEVFTKIAKLQTQRSSDLGFSFLVFWFSGFMRGHTKSSVLKLGTVSRPQPFASILNSKCKQISSISFQCQKQFLPPCNFSWLRKKMVTFYTKSNQGKLLGHLLLALQCRGALHFWRP